MQVDPTMANHSSDLHWFADARLCCTGQASENVFFKGSLACTRVIKEQPTMPLVQDLVHITTDQYFTKEEPAKDQAFEKAQRGPGVSQVMLSSLLDGVPLSPQSTAVVVDPLPHEGDRILATYSVAAEGRGTFKHVVVMLDNSRAPPQP